MREHRHAGVLAVIGLVASALGITFGLLIDWFPPQATREGRQIDTLWDVLIIISVPVFVLVTVIVLYSVWRWRVRPGDEFRDGPPMHGNTKLEVIWTAIPAIILVALCSYSFVMLRDIEEADADALGVRVVAEQFSWKFYYRDPEGKPFVSPQLYLPAGRQVKFTVQSNDVVHNFWVPAFRLKIDAVPGINTRLRVTPEKKGSYPVVCAELCGLGHAVMRQTAHVVDPGAFDDFLERRGPQEKKRTGPIDGKTVFTEAGCGSCHALADVGATGSSGPDLDETIADATRPEITEAILDPEAEIAEGFQSGIMPTTYGETLSEDELRALTRYLTRVAGKS